MIYTAIPGHLHCVNIDEGFFQVFTARFQLNRFAPSWKGLGGLNSIFRPLAERARGLHISSLVL